MADRELPASIEAEQIVLGTIMLYPDYLDRIGFLVPDHFYDPVHADILRACLAKRSKGEHVSPVTLKTTLGNHPGLQQLGGAPYLARLVGAVPIVSVGNVRDIALDVVEMAARRDVIRAAEMAITAATSLDEAGGADAALIGLEADIDAIRERIQRRAPSVHMAEALAKAVERMARSIREGPATPTGIAALDRLMGGLYAGDMILLGGRPSMGKTALAQSIARRVAARGRAVVFASLEMQSEDLMIRMLSEALRERGAEVPYLSIRRGAITEDESGLIGERALAMDRLPIEIIESHIRRLPRLEAEISRIVRRWRQRGHEIGAVIVDYLGLIQPADDRWQSDNSRVAHFSASLKGLFSELKVPGIVLSQLNRQVENRDDKRPQMSDLRDSGSLEQDADAILFAYREEYYLERRRPHPDDPKWIDWMADLDRARGRMEVIVAKQRMGAVGTVNLACDLATNSIWDLPEDGR